MQPKSDIATDSNPSRRDFMRASTAAAIGAAVAGYSLTGGVYAAGSDQLKIGLVGCGGRGGGAAANALHADSSAKLYAMADLFKDQLDSSLKSLAAQPELAPRIDVAPERQFSGLNAYKGLLETCDVVLLATPPHFRPMHLRAAVEAGKQIFCEKPVAVDPAGVRSVMETVEMAKKKGLNLVSGLCFRYDEAKRELMDKVHNGAVGDITILQENYLTGGLWIRPRKPEWSDMEWQLRNWLYFTWLSGDHIVEQHIHSLDKALWAMKDQPPEFVIASGGRTVRTGPEFGNVYDHFNTVYEWENGVKCFSQCRQWVGADSDTSDYIYGTKGMAAVMQHRIIGENAWKRRATPDMYDAEHRALFAAIRGGKTINNGDYMCKSTLMAIMGRMSAYTGKKVRWDEALNSTLNLSPKSYDFGPFPTAPIAVPGVTDKPAAKGAAPAANAER